jgi:hypothetical protein
MLAMCMTIHQAPDPANNIVECDVQPMLMSIERCRHYRDLYNSRARVDLKQHWFCTLNGDAVEEDR